MTTSKSWAPHTNASLKRLERNIEYCTRESAKQQKLHLEAETQTAAEKAVETYEEVITTLTKAHKEQIEPIDWAEILNEPAPAQPIPTNVEEQLAGGKLNTYRPTMLDKLFCTTGKKKQRLQTALVAARTRDEQQNAKTRAEWQIHYNEWEESQQLAKHILQKDTAAYNEAMERFNPFAETTDLTAPPAFHYYTDYVEVEWYAKTENVVPNFTLSLTQSGMLSKKDVAATKSHELYQDHICSYLIRIGREVLSLLPVNFAVVHMLSDTVDSSTGRLAKQPILSAVLYPETLAELNFDLLHPSEVMKSFKHKMRFSKTTGFKPVDRINAANLPGNHLLQ